MAQMLSVVSVAAKYGELEHCVTFVHGSAGLYTGRSWYVLPRMQMHVGSAVSVGVLAYV